MAVYYNENDPYPAQWLRNLIAAGHIPAGDVDERSIADVKPDDLAGYRQCHFFAGIGGWALAAKLAGWPDDRELWTGSCPCQLFSVAGKGAGQLDPRHLWPDWFRLISERRPAVVMGEQVAAAIKHSWLDGVFDDLESQGYSCETPDFPACAINAPIRRERIWFVASTDGKELERWEGMQERSNERPSWQGGMDEPLGIANGSGWQPWEPTIKTTGFWDSAIPASCGDGKYRRIEPRIQRLANGVPARVAKLRAIGNAIVPQVGAEVIRSFIEHKGISNDKRIRWRQIKG